MEDPLVVEVTVRDLHPGLTSKEALIGTRNMNSAVNSVRVHCTDSYSGERTKEPNAEADELQYGFIDAEALGNKLEPQSEGGTVPTHLTHAYADAGTAGQHGLDHPTIVIDLPELECECEYSHFATTSSGREESGAASSMVTRTCREEGEVYWIVPVRGLVVGIVFEVHFDWSLDLSGENTHHWNTVFTPSASSYKVKHPLEKSQRTLALNIHTSTQNTNIPQKEPFFVEVTVRDMRPGLTSEEALIGIRRLNSAVNTVRLRCADPESGERMPDGGEDEWKYNFSAAPENGSLPSPNSTFNTHIFVFERPPHPKRGYGPVRCASISLPHQADYPLFSWVVDALNLAGSNKVDVAVLPELFAGDAPQVPFAFTRTIIVD
jgi:hypothetical protein